VKYFKYTSIVFCLDCYYDNLDFFSKHLTEGENRDLSH
jgi:hypothetical protein